MNACMDVNANKINKMAGKTPSRISDIINITGGYEIQIFDKEGRKIKEITKCTDDLITSNLAMLLLGMLSSGGTSSGATGFAALTATDGTTYDVASIDIQKTTGEAGENDDSFGILVGSGSTAASANDYKLDNKIDKNTLEYGACTAGQYGTGNNLKPGLERKFTNNGSNNVQVNEIGLVLKMSVTTTSGNSSDIYVMMMRDVINPISIPSGGILNVKYYFNLNPST